MAVSPCSSLTRTLQSPASLTVTMPDMWERQSMKPLTDTHRPKTPESSYRNVALAAMNRSVQSNVMPSPRPVTDTPPNAGRCRKSTPLAAHLDTNLRASINPAVVQVNSSRPSAGTSITGAALSGYCPAGTSLRAIGRRYRVVRS